MPAVSHLRLHAERKKIISLFLSHICLILLRAQWTDALNTIQGTVVPDQYDKGEPIIIPSECLRLTTLSNPTKSYHDLAPGATTRARTACPECSSSCVWKGNDPYAGEPKGVEIVKSFSHPETAHPHVGRKAGTVAEFLSAVAERGEDTKDGVKTDRVAVVLYPTDKDLEHVKGTWSWLAGLRVVGVAGNHGRAIGESYGYIKWIVENYDCLPKYVVFLHGKVMDWHRRAGFHRDVMEGKPETFMGLSNMFGKDYGEDILEHVVKDPSNREHNGVHAWSKLFFGNASLVDVMNAYPVTHLSCCTEAVVSRSAIQYWPVHKYRAVLCLMEAFMDHTPWGWVMERMWEPMFDAKYIVPKLKNN